MKIYTICEFIYLEFPYARTGIEIVSEENIYISNNDYTHFLEKYSGLARVSYSEAGEHLYECNLETPECFYIKGVYKDIQTKKYYIVTHIE